MNMAPALAVHQPSGIHILADFYGIAPAFLSDQTSIQTVLLHSAEVANANIVMSHFHSFGIGLGITGVVMLEESHISIHTWPEYGFAALDIFMCGQADGQRALQALQDAFLPLSTRIHTRSRGCENATLNTIMNNSITSTL
ncbi:MAG: adenosylmethionine decarboxylase [Pseudomonadota bacterium]